MKLTSQTCTVCPVTPSAVDCRSRSPTLACVTGLCVPAGSEGKQWAAVTTCWSDTRVPPHATENPPPG